MDQGTDCIIFDLDGTISDPSEGIARCVNHALERYGYEPVDPGRVAPLIGPPLTEIFEELLGTVDDDRMLGLVAACNPSSAPDAGGSWRGDEGPRARHEAMRSSCSSSSNRLAS